MDDGCAGLDEALGAVVAVGQEDAVGSHCFGDFKIVQCVANEDDLGGFPVELSDPFPPLLYFASCINIVCTDQSEEMFGDAEVADAGFEGGLFGGREYGMAEAEGSQAFQGMVYLRVQGAFFEPACFVVTNEFVADLLEAVAVGVEAEKFVEVDDGEAEMVTIGFFGQRCPAPLAQQAVEYFDAEPSVIQQGAVPVPDNVFVGGMHGLVEKIRVALEERGGGL